MLGVTSRYRDSQPRLTLLRMTMAMHTIFKEHSTYFVESAFLAGSKYTKLKLRSQELKGVLTNILERTLFADPTQQHNDTTFGSKNQVESIEATLKRSGSMALRFVQVSSSDVKEMRP
jgi:hypothetical protein